MQEYPVKPVACKGRYFKRHGASNHQLTSDEIVELKLKSLNASFDSFAVPGEVDKAAPKTAPKTAPKSTRERIILLLREDSRLTKQDLMRKLQKASGTIKEHIRILKREGVIKHIGPAKGGHWEVMGRKNDE